MATKVFISWSGETSGAVAQALRVWLPRIIQSVQPFMSSADIAAGSRPLADIEMSLEEAQFGIICVSSENWNRPWLNFEAGAISKRLGLEETRVSPLLIDLRPEDIDSPLKQFQMKRLDERGVFEVLHSLNELCGDAKLSDINLRQTFEVWWPKMEADFEAARALVPTIPVERGTEAKIDELLTLVRGLTRAQAPKRRQDDSTPEPDRMRDIFTEFEPDLKAWSVSMTSSTMRVTTPVPLSSQTKFEIFEAYPEYDVVFDNDLKQLERDALDAEMYRDVEEESP